MTLVQQVKTNVLTKNNVSVANVIALLFAIVQETVTAYHQNTAEFMTLRKKFQCAHLMLEKEEIVVVFFHQQT